MVYLNGDDVSLRCGLKEALLQRGVVHDFHRLHIVGFRGQVSGRHARRGAELPAVILLLAGLAGLEDVRVQNQVTRVVDVEVGGQQRRVVRQVALQVSEGVPDFQYVLQEGALQQAGQQLQVRFDSRVVVVAVIGDYVLLDTFQEGERPLRI